MTTWLAPFAKGEEMIKDKSPNGKFSLRIAKGEEDWEAAIIDARTKKTVLDLEAYGAYVKEARLVWSNDSQRVAYFSPSRRGGTATIYFRNGSAFSEIELPGLSTCEENSSAQDGDKYVKTTASNIVPKKWLKSGALVFTIDHEWVTESGGSFHCSARVTVAFDSNQKASVQSVTEKKITRE
jgi:hypothetical protein